MAERRLTDDLRALFNDDAEPRGQAAAPGATIPEAEVLPSPEGEEEQSVGEQS